MQYGETAATAVIGDEALAHPKVAAALRIRRTVRAASNQRHGGTVLGEPAGGGSADAAARTSDQGGGAGQCRFHGMLSCSLEVRRRGRRQERHLKASVVLSVTGPVPAQERVG
jgi:hypothetical protein